MLFIKTLRKLTGLISLILSMLIFTPVHSTVFNKKSTSYLDSSAVSKLIKNATLETTDGNTDSLLAILENAKYAPFQDTVLKTLRSFFSEKRKVPFLVKALGSRRSLYFDYELSILSKDLKVLNDNQKNGILLALANSGANMTFSSLMKTCQIPVKSTDDPNLIETKVKLWKLLFTKQPFSTTNLCLGYYALTIMNENELERTAGAPEMISDFVSTLSRNKNLLIQLLPSIRNFLLITDLNNIKGRSPKFPSILLGDFGSNKYKINKYFYKLLLNMNSIFSLSVLIELTRCDDEEIRKTVSSLPYDKLKNSTLFVKQFNKTYDTTIHRQVFGDIKRLTPDFSNFYISPANYMNILNYRYFITGLQGPVMIDTPVIKTNTTALFKAYDVAITNTFYNLASRYNFEDKNFKDTIQDYLKTNVWIPNYDNNFYSFKTLSDYLQLAVKNALQSQQIKNSTADSTAMIIVGKEMERKAITAYVLNNVCRNRNIHLANANFNTIDYLLDSILRSKKMINVLHTQVVGSLINFKKNLLSKAPKKLTSLQVIARKLSFVDGLYYEKLKFKNENNIEQIIEWYGVIPISLINHLTQNPRLFDPTAFSFAFNEIANGNENYLNEIDFTRIDPENALTYLLYSLNNPNIPWQDIKEALILNPFREYETQGFKDYVVKKYDLKKDFSPKPMVKTTPWYPELNQELKVLAERGFPGGINFFWGTYVAVSDDDYKKKREEYLQPFFYLMLHKAYKRLNEIVLNYNINEVPETQPCKDFDFLCDLDIITVENKKRLVYIENGKAAIANSAKVEQYLQAWDLTNFVIDNNSKLYLRQLIISNDYKTFLGTYEVTSGDQVKYVNLEGKLGDLPKELQTLIEKKPNFVSQYHLDLSGASNGAMHKISQAIYSEFNQDYGLYSFNRLLRESGYAYIKPLALGFIPKGPLFKSDEGKTLAAEQVFVNKIADYGLGGLLTDDSSPTPVFIDAVKNFWQESVNFADNQARTNAAQLIANANKKNEDILIAFGFTASNNGGGIAFSLELNYKSISFKLSSSPNLKDLKLDASVYNMKWLPVTFNLGSLFSKKASDQPIDKVITYNVLKPNQLSFNDIPTLSLSTTFVYPENLPRTTKTPDAHPRSQANAGLPANWMQMSPIIGPGPWAIAEEANGNREWLYNLIWGARSKFNEQELKELTIAAAIGLFPEKLVEVVIAKRNQAIEEDNIASGEWIKTDVADGDLIPNIANRNGLSAKEYIDDVNKKSDETFEKEVSNKQNAIESKAVFDNGMPGVQLLYSKDYRYMMWTYNFKCVDGTIISKQYINEVYVGLIPLLIKNPNGHVLEKLTSMAAEQFINYSNLSNPLRHAEYKKFEEAESLWNQLKDMREETATNIKDYLHESVDEFLKEHKIWQKNNDDNKHGVEHPFDPKPSGAPMLNLFPSPMEIQQRRNEAIKDMLTRQRSSSFSQGLREKDIFIEPILP